jgi:hypothetical protein
MHPAETGLLIPSVKVGLQEVISALGIDSGRITSNSDVTRLGKGCRPSDQKRPYMVRAINKYASPRRLDFGRCNGGISPIIPPC